MAKKISKKAVVTFATSMSLLAAVALFAQNFSYSSQAAKKEESVSSSAKVYQGMQDQYIADPNWAKVNDRITIKENATQWSEDNSDIEGAVFPMTLLPGFHDLQEATTKQNEFYLSENEKQVKKRFDAWNEAKKLCELTTASKSDATTENLMNLANFTTSLSEDAKKHNLSLYAEYCGINNAEVKVVVEQATAIEEARAGIGKQVLEESAKSGLTPEQYVRQKASESGLSLEEYAKRMILEAGVAAAPAE